MTSEDREEKLLRSVAFQNAHSILLARKQAEEELLRAKEELERRSDELAHSLAIMRATLELTTDGILVTDGSGKVTGFNAKFVEMWQIVGEEMDAGDHRRILELTSRRFADPAGFLARIEEIYAASPPETYDLLETLEARAIERFSRIQRIADRNVGRVWTFRDITVRRKSEEALREEALMLELLAAEREALLKAERAAREEAQRVSLLKDEFLANVSHELRTPLNAILGWAQVMATGTVSSEDLRQGLETIARNARAQAQLIEDLLDMSRIASGKVRLDVQETDLAAVVQQAINTVRPSAEAKEIRLRQIIDPRIGPVSGDPNRLQQVVWNLLSNAVKFTPKGGKVDVILQRVNSNLEITINDSGIGIEPEFLPHVFERFRQADSSTTRVHGGLGLGLSIVKQLVELHGGTVRAQSEGEGRGAAFSVCLPLAPVRADESREHPATSSTAILDCEGIDLAGIRVLVVDDEADARELIKRVLAHCHAEVITASSAAEALQVLRTQSPRVLVSDIGMPEMDGYQFIRQVRLLPAAEGGKVPAIALTAFARSEDRTRAMMAGYQMHIAKPIEPQELVATVANIAGLT